MRAPNTELRPCLLAAQGGSRSVSIGDMTMRDQLLRYREHVVRLELRDGRESLKAMVR